MKKTKLNDIKPAKIEAIFQAPEEYFEKLPKKILQKIKNQPIESSLEANEHLRQNIFNVPQGYFNDLLKRIRRKIQNSDLQNNTQLKQNVLQVPDNYFQDLSQRIAQRIENEQHNSIKIIRLQTKTPYLKAMAVAAAIALLIVGFWISNLSTTEKNTIAQKTIIQQQRIQTIKSQNKQTPQTHETTKTNEINKEPKLVQNLTNHTHVPKQVLAEVAHETQAPILDSLDKHEILNYLAEETNQHHILIEELHKLHNDNWATESVWAEIALSDLNRLVEEELFETP